VEFLELRVVSLPDGGRHRRRIYRDQLHHPGAGAGALSRLDRSRHQRQFLGRGGARRAGLDRAARSRAAPARHGLAALLLHRRGAGPGDRSRSAMPSPAFCSPARATCSQSVC
jgi:hypothetical protein